MSYTRVIPRDFFNEAKLLKCMGHLSLKILDGMLPAGVKIEIDECGEPFDIDITGSGQLYMSNYNVTINDTLVSITSTYNSKEPFPLICYYDDTEYCVFDDNGEFTAEFIELATNIN